MQRSTRDHPKLPPPSTIPSDGYPSSPRGYDMMTKGGSRYEHGPGYAHRGGYGLPEHRDKVINPSQYQNRFEVLEPHQGRNDIRLPGIEALDKLSHQDHWPPTSGRDTAGRIPQKQNTRCMEAQSESKNIDTLAKPHTQGRGPSNWHRGEDGKLINYVRDGYNWTEIGNMMRRTGESVKKHWYYGNLKSDPRAQGLSYRPLRSSGASLQPGSRP